MLLFLDLLLQEEKKSYRETPSYKEEKKWILIIQVDTIYGY
jgi:hypothetical protein